MNIAKTQIENLDIFLSIKEKADKYKKNSFTRIFFVSISSILLLGLSAFLHIKLFFYINSFFEIHDFFNCILITLFMISSIYFIALPFDFFRFFKLKKYKTLNVPKNIYETAYSYYYSQNLSANPIKSRNR